MGAIERKLYKVLRNVGVRKNYISKAKSIDDLFLDEFDRKLLRFYFENEFKVRLSERDELKLTTLNEVNGFLRCTK
ncbi:MAG TPA: hypothetical protein PKJ43_01270 [Prolixibacteraceae bacterium]|nr:hypothetical protein [Bacteroidales bacterium]HNZ71217.1 hypothetical protein [Prolixibacteraceae bacterium]HQN94649.1 hypothetical protein [Prolixibacteraceae bacterium]HUM88541.1 hypothetical protein [Prolixibacteraceae bacterium]